VTLLSFSGSLRATELKVAVASNFYHSLKLLLANSHAYKERVKLSSGSSGLLYAQISNGAPFDVFLSADSERPQQLVQRGLAHSAQTYALGQIVLWSNKDLLNHNENILTLLGEYEGKLAIANPKLAPYGKAAVEVLQGLDIYEKLKHQLVKASNVNHAFQFVDTGNAPLAIISKAQLIQAQLTQQNYSSNKYSAYFEIPKGHYSAIAQQAVVLNSGIHQEEASRFLLWLMSEKTQQHISALGYQPGTGDK
jgi:molybdenum ABC transporter molybdate-binding protein